jgi:enoyl-CoA hydratase
LSMSSANDVHLIRLEGDNANAIDEKLMETLTKGLRAAVDADKKAVVLTGYDKFFSAGLNLKSLPEDRDGMASFVDSFEEAHLALLQFPLPVVAAVNGHAIAGGCVLACAADLRVGAEGSHKLGVSEVSLGIIFPAVAFEIMRYTLTRASIPDVLLGGKLLSPPEALTAGILHRVVPAEALLDEALAAAGELGNQPRQAFHHSKLALREPMLERIRSTRDEARRGFLDTWFSPEVVARRKAMLA